MTESGDVGEEVSVVDVPRSLVDVDSDLVRDFDETSFECLDDLVLRQL